MIKLKKKKLIYLDFFYRLINKYLNNIKKQGKSFLKKKILNYFFFLKFNGFNLKFFFFKKIRWDFLYVGFGYSKKKKRFPRKAKIPIKIRKFHQFSITIRLFSIFSFKKYYILLMYSNNNDFSNEFIFNYQEKILEEKYYIERR